MPLRACAMGAMLCALVGCASQPLPPPAGPPPLRRTGVVPAPDMVGVCRARRVERADHLPTGPGAEGRVGDFLLENALARFVIAGPERGSLTGNLIDAAATGGVDRMRLLVPHVGVSTFGPPVYESVSVLNAGSGRLREEPAPAVVAATGRLPGYPGVTVRTLYSLLPNTDSLGVDTTLVNESDAPLRDLTFGDRLLPGRTVRFTPRLGLAPRGAERRTTWMAFFGQSGVWGVLLQDGQSMKARHEVGCSWLQYRSVTIPPGQGRTFSRELTASLGGPERVWDRAYPCDEERAVLELVLTVPAGDPETAPVLPGRCEVAIVPSDEERSAFLAMTDVAGRLRLDLPPGRYMLAAAPPGRPSWGPVKLHLRGGRRHRATGELEDGGTVALRARARILGQPSETPARVNVHVRDAEELTSLPNLPFPAAALGGRLGSPGHLMAPRGGLRVDMAGGRRGLAGGYVFIVSRGPLYGSRAANVLVRAGQCTTLEVELPRVITPGDYVAVDMRQYAYGSRDSALRFEERALSNTCEGLDAGVVCDPPDASAERRVGMGGAGASALVPGLRLDLPGVGAFSAWPADPGRAQRRMLAKLLATQPTFTQLVAAVRRACPEAAVQVDAPLDAATGYLALRNRDALPERPLRDLGQVASCDVLELLSGGDVDAARRLLPVWFDTLNKGRKISITGGSGARGLIDPVAGVARTYVRVASGAGAAGLPQTLKKFRTGDADAFVTNGPFIVADLDGAPIGSQRRNTSGAVQLSLTVSAAPWVDVRRVTVYRNGVVVKRFDVPDAHTPVRLRETVRLPVPQDSWFVIVVEGGRSMSAVYGRTGAPTPFAATNPFYVTVK
jgi:hypothetical protein